MDAPPMNGSPYDLVPSGDARPGVHASVNGWQATIWFWGRVAGQAWTDLANIQGGPIVT